MFKSEFLARLTRHHRPKGMFQPMQPLALFALGVYLIPIASYANDPLLPPTYQVGKEYRKMRFLNYLEIFLLK